MLKKSFLKVDVVNQKDECFNELLDECRHSSPGSKLTFQLRLRLEKFSPEIRKEIVNRIRAGCAPLFIACKKGQTEIVEYLISVCGADVEQRGLYEVPDERSVHYVTPLWCAAVSGRSSVMRTLLDHGADINAVSDTGSTPVRSACFMSHIEIVHSLVLNGADINRANYNGGTCLINSVQSEELCKFLIDYGANVNAIDIQNKTALHYAIQEHRLETTKLLLDKGADYNILSRYGDDALQTACLKGAVTIFNYLKDTIRYPLEKVVDGYELLGTTLLDEHNDVYGAINHWRMATVIREANQDLLPKRPIPPKAAYKYNTEFTSLDELNAVLTDLDLIRIHSLLIAERILGPFHKDTVFRLMFRGASYVDGLHFQNCIDLWRRALEIRVHRDSILYSDTCFSAQALVRLMIDFNEKCKNEILDNDGIQRFEDITAVFHLLVKDITDFRNIAIIKPVHKRQVDNFDKTLKCIIHLIYLMLQTTKTYKHSLLVKQLVTDLILVNPKTITGEETLLHLCVSKLNLLRSSYFVDEEPAKIFPHAGVIRYLLDCGASVNARNEYNSTPLHTATSSYNYSSWLIKLLLKYKAHIDLPNSLGERPCDRITENPYNSEIFVLNYITLKCLCATNICLYKIPYVKRVPKTLEYFIQQHQF